MLAIIAAMQNEADTLLSSAQIEQSYTEHGKRVWEGEAFGVPFLLILSGIGKSNAAAAAMLALTLGADRLLGFGAAGGITAQAHIGFPPSTARLSAPSTNTKRPTSLWI